MTNSSIKRRIEKAADVVIRISHYKCGGWEGYAEALRTGDGPRRERYVAGESTAGHRTRMDATTTVLIYLANRLGVDLPDSVHDIVQRRADADFECRTQ